MELDADDLLVEDAVVSADETEEIGSAELLRVENAATALAIHEAANASVEPPGAVVVAPIVELSAPPTPADPMGPTVAAFVEPAATPLVGPVAPATSVASAAPVEPLGATVAAPDPIGPTVAVFPEATAPILASSDAASPLRVDPPRPEPPRPGAFREKSEYATLIGAPARGPGGAVSPAVGPLAEPNANEHPAVAMAEIDVLASTAPAHASAHAPAAVEPAAHADVATAAAAEQAPVSDALPVRAPWLTLKDRRIVIALVAALALLCVVGFVIASMARTDAVASVDGQRSSGAESPAARAPAAREDDVPPPAQAETTGVTAAANESPTTAAADPAAPSPDPAPEANEATVASAEKPAAPSPLDETPAPDAVAHARSETKAHATQARRTKPSASPPSLPAPAPAAPAPVSSVGTVRVNDGLSVIQVDGRYVRVQGGAVSVACGTHKIKAGMGNARVVVVPCGGTVAL